MTAASPSFSSDETHALERDATDPLAALRGRFFIPKVSDGGAQVYLCGNSLGLQPRDVATVVGGELENWASLAVEAHFRGPRPWYSYHELMRESGADLVGARAGEVVMMNSLTVNLHLMMVSFYRPTASCYKILTDGPLFPSDRFALRSQIEHHGYSPDDALIVISGDDAPVDSGRFEEVLERAGDAIALVLLSGVNYHTGQLFDIARIAGRARAHGCRIGLDLAHAAGNVPLALHDWDVDFAVWCSYKYLNAGPGAVGGCFVHERHAETALPRFAGWWGVDPDGRFQMQKEDPFVPQRGAEGWQLSNPPVLAMAPLYVSLEIFRQAGMAALRTKSQLLTAYLEFLLQDLLPERCVILTPPDPAARGCQLSLQLGENAKDAVSQLAERGMVVDYRPPGVIRAAPVPLYNTFHDVWRFAHALEEVTR